MNVAPQGILLAKLLPMVLFRYASAAALVSLTFPVFAAPPVARPDLTNATANPQLLLGRELLVYWNRALLHDVGIEVAATLDALPSTVSHFDRFAVARSPGMAPATRGGGVKTSEVSALRVVGGYRLITPHAVLALKDFTLRLRPTLPRSFDIVSSNGEVLFSGDNAMVESADGRAISISAMDLRVSPRLAKLLHRPEATGWSVGSVRMLPITSPGALREREEACPTSARWPGMPVAGHPGAYYKADVFMQGLWTQVTGCRGCAGPMGTGQIKLTPTTVLRNNINDGSSEPTVVGDPAGTSGVAFAADIPWRTKFSRACPPYDNDEHPFLVWNLYRWDAEGTLTQVARSGVKHSHVAANTACLDNPGSNHVLGRGCQDVYGAGDNDAPDTLGPRSEIIPFQGLWGRCGSIYDPNCTGRADDFRGYDEFAYRLMVQESEFAAGAHRGAKYLLEAWYVVRDDVDPYNSMAHQDIELAWNADHKLWAVGASSAAKVGAVIDEWVSPATHSADAMSTEIQSPYGRVKLAVRATPLSNHRFRYDYAVMNVDFASATTKGVGPNLRIVANHGIERFSVDVSPTAHPTSFQVAYIDSQHAEQWTKTQTASNVSWRANKGNDLIWGTLCRFTFEAEGGPVRTRARLGGNTSDLDDIGVDTLGPN